MNSLRNALVAAAALFSAVTTHSSVSHAAVVNGGFEFPLVNTFVPNDGLYFVPPNYAYPAHGGPPVTFDSWTYNSGAGLITGPNPGAFGGEPSFVGNQYAFIQSVGSSISQVFSATPGIGEIDWLQAGRPNQNPAFGNQTLQIYLNGILVGTVASTTGQDFIAKSISGVTLLTAIHFCSWVLRLATILRSSMRSASQPRRLRHCPPPCAAR